MPSPNVRAVTPAPDGGYPNNNTAEGDDALFSLTTGTGNTAVGFNALYNNIGAGNTATGSRALINNTIGGSNTANGGSALQSNKTGGNNTATGFNALVQNTTGDDNTATGREALSLNTTGEDNTANGELALSQNTTGDNNIALGHFAGDNLTTGDNNIDIGNEGVAAEANTIRIGTQGTQRNAYIAGIYNATVAKGVAVVVDSTGHLGTKGSSERLKDAIKPMNKASEAILALKPVTFHYKKELDPEGIPQFGLVAEEVAKVDPDLVVRDSDGKPYTVRYEAVNAMLLNEFLKEHRKVVAQDRQLQTQAATIARQQKQIDALTAGLQKVNDQLELNKLAPRLVGNDH